MDDVALDVWGSYRGPSAEARPDGLDLLRVATLRPATASATVPADIAGPRGGPMWLTAVVGVLLLGGLVALTRAQAVEQPHTNAVTSPRFARATGSAADTRSAHVPVVPALLSGPAPEPAPASPLAMSPGPGSPAPPFAVPPVPGRYDYAVTSNGGTDEPASLDVTRAGATTYRLRFNDPGGTNRVDEQHWGTSLISLTDSTAGGQQCHWSPSAPWMRGDLKLGVTWRVASECSVVLDSAGHRGILRESEGATVVSDGYVVVGHRRVFVWAVRRVTSITESDSNSRVVATANERSTDLFAPHLGLVVQTTAQTQSPTRAGGSKPAYIIIRMLDTRPH